MMPLSAQSENQRLTEITGLPLSEHKGRSIPFGIVTPLCVRLKTWEQLTEPERSHLVKECASLVARSDVPAELREWMSNHWRENNA